MIHAVTGSSGLPAGNLNTAKLRENADSGPVDSVVLCSGKDLAALEPTLSKKEILGGMQLKAEDAAELKASVTPQKQSVPDKAMELVEQTLGGMKAFPGFIYPSVAGATPQEFQFTYDVLDKLPLKDVSSIDQIQWTQELSMFLDPTKKASGMAIPTGFTDFMQIARDECGRLDNWGKEVIIHETGHMRDFSEGLFDLISQQSSKDPMWGQGPHISEYAKTNRWEDFAESYATYHIDPEGLQAQCPEKYEKIKELESMGLTDQFIENDAFRETGKFIGQSLSKVPYLQTGLSVASYGLNVFNLIKGIGKMREGSKTGDEQKQMEGTMEAASGLLYATKVLAMGGLAVDGAKQAMNRAIREGDITPAQANHAAQNTVGAPVTLVKNAKNWVKNKIQKTDKEELAVEKAAKKEKTKGSSKALAIGAGGAAGSVAGSLLGIYGGVSAGYAAAGPIGGAIGLVLGSAIGVSSMNQVGGNIGTIVGELIQKPDKEEKEAEKTLQKD